MLRRCLFLLIFVFLAIPGFATEIAISFNKQPNVPYLISPQLTVDSSEFSAIILNIKAKQAGSARLMWANHYDPQFNQQKSITLRLQKGEKTYYLNILAQNKNWIGWIKGLLVYPENTQIEVKDAKLTTGNWATYFLSAWQEFFAFEEPQPRSVNFLYGPRINGWSINIYIYFLILAFLIFIFKLGPKRIVLICLLFWFLLDLRIIIDQARTIKLDLDQFAGKSLEAKRAQTTPGDFYDFLKFVDAKLPKGSGFNLIIAPNYYYLPKANYYLYPTHYDKNAAYVLVYDPQESLEHPKKGYSLLAEYKKGEYIIEK